jgi:hypothetical protein
VLGAGQSEIGGEAAFADDEASILAHAAIS